MDGELKFKAVFDYGDAQKSVDELFDIFERGEVKMNEAFNFGRTVQANKKQLRDMVSSTRQVLKDLETVYANTMQYVKEKGGLAYITEEERTALGNLMGMQQVYNALQSTSAFRLQVTAKATEMLAAAEAKLATASGAAKVALGGLVVVLAAAVGALAAFASRHEKNKELSKEFSDQVVNGATQQVLAYRKLQAQWEQASGELEKQRKIVASDDWRKLGITVNNINDAEKVLVDNSDAVVRSMIAKAKAAALLAEAQNDIAKAVRNENKAENAENGNYTIGQTIRGVASSLIPGLVGARYVQKGWVDGEYIDTEANKPQRKDYQSGKEYRDAWIKFIAESDAVGYRDKAKQATEDAMESIRASAEYDDLGDEILRSLGLANDPNGKQTINRLPEIIEKQMRELERKTKDLQLETDQARIDAMEEGTAKTLAQIDLNFKKEEEAIQRWYDDLIDEKIARDKELWEADPRNAGKPFEYNREDYANTPEEARLRKLRDLANEKNKLDAVQAVFDKYLTFAEKFGKSVGEFEREIRDLKDAGASIDAIGVAAKMAGENFNALAKSWMESGWDEGLVEMTILLTDLEGQLEAIGDSLPEEETALLRAQVEALREALRQSRNETDQDKTSWTDLTTVLTDSAALFKQIGEAIGGAFGDALEMVGQFASSLAKVLIGIEAFNKPGASFAEKFTAGVSIASSALSVLSSVVSKIRESIQRTEELNLATLKYEQTLQRIKDSQVLNSFVNAFGTDRYGRFVSSMDIAKNAQANIANLLGGFSRSGNPLADMITGVNHSGNDLVSDMRTNWQQFWGSGKKNIFAADWSDFIGENGDLLGEELKSWYETYGEGLTEENKKLVESIIAEWERWEEAVEEINGYLSDLFNNVTGSLSDKMLDNFLATGNAIVDMSDYLDDFSRSLAKSIIQSRLLGEVFDDVAKDKIAQLIAKGDVEGAVEAYESLLGQANALAPNINEWLTRIGIKDTARAQDATAGGFQVMSQDQASELNGRFTALQIAGENILLETQGIHSDTNSMNSLVGDIQGLALISMGHLEDIAKYTSVLPDMSERMERIEKYSKQMVS